MTEQLSYVYVRMADDEWQSSHDMTKIAAEQFALHPERPLVVNVQEHAGWWLEYSMSGDNLIVVGTANDGATISDDRREFWKKYGKVPSRNLCPTIYRNELPMADRDRCRW